MIRPSSLALSVALSAGCLGGAPPRLTEDAGRATPLDGAVVVVSATSDASFSETNDLGSTATPSSSDMSQESSCATPIPPVPATSGPTLHVAVAGSDESGNGSSASPYATLGRALQGVQPGTRIQLGGGTYKISTVSEYNFTNINGTAAEPIVVTAEPGQTPIFDATGATGASYATQPVFMFNSSSYVFVDSIVVANSPNTGFGFLNASHCTITRSIVHDSQQQSIEVVGSDLVVAGNEVYDGAMLNVNGTYAKQGNGWPGTIITWYLSDDGVESESQNVKVVQNYVHDTWGECIDALFVNGIDITDNTLVNCYSAMVYLSPASNVNVLRNRLYFTSSSSLATTSDAPSAISIDEEFAPYFPEDNILIANNYFPARVDAIFRFDGSSTSSSSNTWSNLSIVNNIFAGGDIYFEQVYGSTAPSKGVMQNNIFLDTTSVSLADASAWTIANNDFVKGVPSGFTGNGNFSASPQFAGPADGTSFTGLKVTNASALQVPSSSLVGADALCAPRTTMTTAGPIGP